MKKLLITMVVALTILSLAGCVKRQNDGNNMNGMIPSTNNETKEADETISPIIDQFGEIIEGETVAEIKIKNHGSISVRFFVEAAPKAVENFITLAKEGYYDGVIFHRIIDDFMIQGGDDTGIGTGGKSIWGDPFEDEFYQTLYPLRGSLCMANSGPNTNKSQFFLVQSSETYDEEMMEYISKETKIEFNEGAKVAYREIGGTPWLYTKHTVFGQVYAGLELLDKLAAVSTDKNGRPLEEVVIETIRIFGYE